MMPVNTALASEDAAIDAIGSTYPNCIIYDNTENALWLWLPPSIGSRGFK